MSKIENLDQKYNLKKVDDETTNIQVFNNDILISVVGKNCVFNPDRPKKPNIIIEKKSKLAALRCRENSSTMARIGFI